MAIKAIFLDWDGTLINSFGINYAAINKTLEHYGKDPVSEDYYAAAYGLSSRELFSLLFEELAAINDPDAREAFLSEVRKSYYATKAELAETMPLAKIDDADTVMQTLRDLKTNPKNDLFVGIISNKKEEGLLRELKESGWADIVDVAIGKTPDHAGKPSAEPLQKALKHYSGKRLPLGREMLYVGDTDVDCDFSRNNNMNFIGVGAGFTRYIEPTERVGGLAELNTRLQALTIQQSKAAGHDR